MIEQKKVITSYASDYDLPATLTKNQRGIMEKVVRVLAPVELMTREISADDTTVADVIPMLAALMLGINKVTDENHAAGCDQDTLRSRVWRQVVHCGYPTRSMLQGKTLQSTAAGCCHRWLPEEIRRCPTASASAND